MTATLVADAPSSFSRSLIGRPAMTSGASPRTTNKYAHAAPIAARMGTPTRLRGFKTRTRARERALPVPHAPLSTNSDEGLANMQTASTVTIHIK